MSYDRLHIVLRVLTNFFLLTNYILKKIDMLNLYPVCNVCNKIVSKIFSLIIIEPTELRTYLKLKQFLNNMNATIVSVTVQITYKQHNNVILNKYHYAKRKTIYINKY